MEDIMDYDNIWVSIPVTVIIWILIFSVIEVGFMNGSLQSGAIKGFVGGLAFSIAYTAIKKYQNKEDL